MLFPGPPLLCMGVNMHTHGFPSLPLQLPVGATELHVATFFLLLLKASAKPGTEGSGETVQVLPQGDLCQQKCLLCRVPGRLSSLESPKGQLRHSLT